MLLVLATTLALLGVVVTASPAAATLDRWRTLHSLGYADMEMNHNVRYLDITAAVRDSVCDGKSVGVVVKIFSDSGVTHEIRHPNFNGCNTTRSIYRSYQPHQLGGSRTGYVTVQLWRVQGIAGGVNYTSPGTTSSRFYCVCA
jgi:hypothetical protein